MADPVQGEIAGEKELATGEGHPAKHDTHHAEPEVIDPSGPMVLWTWVIFLAMAATLYKVAWKPILGALDQREKSIQDSLDKVEEIDRQLGEIEDTRRETVASADQKAKEVIEDARKGAVEGARSIEAKAKEEAQIQMENARREIKTAEEKAEAALKQESVNSAVVLAEKIIGEEFTDDKKKALVDRLIQGL